MALYNRVKVAITAGGAGNLTIGGPAPMFRGFGDAGVPNGTVVSYVIEDANASLWEYGRGTYTAPSTFDRTTVLATSAGNTTPINAGTSAFLFIDALAEDFAASISVGTPITGGASGRVLFDNGGNLGEAANLTYDGTNTSVSGLNLKGTTNSVKLAANPTTTAYTLTMPLADATVAGQVLSSDAAGNLSWVNQSAYTLPIATTGAIGGVKANTGTGYVSGIAADGSLQFTALPAAYVLPAPTTTTMGGIKRASTSDIVTGVDATGALEFGDVDIDMGVF